MAISKNRKLEIGNVETAFKYREKIGDINVKAEAEAHFVRESFVEPTEELPF